MGVVVNYFAVIAAAVSSMIIGYVWFGPLFGKLWMELSGITPPSPEQAKGGMMKSYALMFVGSLVMAYVLAHSLVFASSYMQVTGVSAGLMAGFWSWLGFVAPVTLGGVLWKGEPWKLWFLNNGYYLLILLVMASILAVWG